MRPFSGNQFIVYRFVRHYIMFNMHFEWWQKSKLIFQLYWALNMQIEYEKCMEIMFRTNANIEPTLICSSCHALWVMTNVSASSHIVPLVIATVELSDDSTVSFATRKFKTNSCKSSRRCFKKGWIEMLSIFHRLRHVLHKNVTT